MRLFNDIDVYNHFNENILKYITHNNTFDKHKIKKLEDEKKLIPIGHGNIAKIYKIKFNDGYYALKLFYENFNKNNSNLDFDHEKHTLLNTSKYVKDNTCPHFLYSYYVSTVPYLYILLEYADGTVYDFLNHYTCTEDNTEIYIETIKSMIFQILIGLLVLHEMLETLHNDVHLKNLFYKKIDNDTILYYNINNTIYKVKSYGYLFMLGDFGKCISYSILKSQKYIYVNTNKIEEYKKYKSRVYPIIVEKYDSLKILHNRIIKEYQNNMGDINTFVKRNIISEDDYNTAFTYITKQNVSKEDFYKKFIQYIYDNDYIKIDKFLPPYILNVYILFKNTIPYIFTFAEYIQIANVILMFYTTYIIPKIDKNVDIVYNIHTINHSVVLKKYRKNIDVKKTMYNINKYLKTFTTKYNTLKIRSLDEFIKKYSSDVKRSFKCSEYVNGIEYKNEYGYAQILQYSNDKKYKKEVDNELLIRQKLTELVNNNICPHFFKSYMLNIKDNSELVALEMQTNTFNILIKSVTGKSFYDKIILNSDDIRYSFFFQVIYTGYCLIKYFNINADNLHMKSQAFEYINIHPSTVFHYIIDGVDYYVPSFGYMLMMRTESIIKLLINSNMIQLFNENTNCFRQFKIFYIMIIYINLSMLNINTIDDLIYLIDDYEFKIKFLEYIKYITAFIENAYVTIDSDIQQRSKSKNDYVTKGVYFRCLDYIITNNINIFDKIIDKDKIYHVIQLKKFITNIIIEKNINSILENFFSFYKIKRKTVKTFIL